MVDKLQVVGDSLHERVYESIKKSIIQNEYLPGQELIIGNLAESLGVSPTPVRETLARLRSEGLVEQKNHKRPTVVDIDENYVRYTYEVRRIIEPYAYRLIAGYVAESSAKELTSLKSELEEIRELIDNVQSIIDSTNSLDSDTYEDYSEIDFQLQKIVLDYLENPLLSDILRSVSNKSVRIRTFAEIKAKKADDIDLMKAINREHLNIIQDLVKGKPEKTKTLVENHLDHAKERTIQRLTETDRSRGKTF